MLDQAPKWFLIIAIVSIVSILPLLISQEKRMTILETQLQAIQKNKIEDDRRLLVVLDRLDDSVNNLNLTVASLKTEVENIKEK